MKLVLVCSAGTWRRAMTEPLAQSWLNGRGDLATLESAGKIPGGLRTPFGRCDNKAPDTSIPGPRPTLKPEKAVESGSAVPTRR